MIDASTIITPGDMARVQKAIEDRQRLLGKSAQDSVVYGAIRMLTSLRASTRKGQTTRKALPYKPEHGRPASDRYHMRGGVLRQIWGLEVWEQGLDHPRVKVPMIQHPVGRPSKREGENANAYHRRLRLSGLMSMRPACSRGEAESSRLAKIGRVGLAQRAWVVAQAELLGKGSSGGDRTANIARENVSTTRFTGLHDCMITINNRLGYAAMAFKESGSQAVSTAAKRCYAAMTAVLMKRLTGSAIGSTSDYERLGVDYPGGDE